MSLKGKAKEVLTIIEEGGYHTPRGDWVDLKDAISYSVNHSTLYTPEQFNELTAITGSAPFSLTSIPARSPSSYGAYFTVAPKKEANLVISIGP